MAAISVTRLASSISTNGDVKRPMPATRPSRFSSARALTLVASGVRGIGRVQLIDRDAIDAQRMTAAFASRPQMLRPSTYPVPSGRQVWSYRLWWRW